MNIRDEIAKSIENKRYSIRQVDRITGVSHTTIRNFLDGKMIKIELFLKLINGLDFSLIEEKELIEKYKFEIPNKNVENYTLSFNETKRMKLRLKELEKSLEIGDLQNKIPIYSSVSAGVGCIPDAEPIDWLYTSKKKDLKGVVVDGKSMEPYIRDRSIVIFDENMELRNRDVGVFLLEGEGFVKRILKTDKGIMLLSDNNEFDPIFIDKYDNFKICGKVVRIVSDV